MTLKNFIIDLNNEWITIKDDEEYFGGQYNQSNNKKFLIAYTDAHIEIDENNKEVIVLGQICLIKNKKEILWKKSIARPNGAFVTDEGLVVVIDWLSFGIELSGKIHFFNKNGEKIFNYKFDSNIANALMKEDVVYVITCNPDNSIYRFSIKERKLLDKINNFGGYKLDIKTIEKYYKLKSNKQNNKKIKSNIILEKQKALKGILK